MGRFLDLLQQISSEPDPEPIVESVVLNTFRSMTYKRKRK